MRDLWMVAVIFAAFGLLAWAIVLANQQDRERREQRVRQMELQLEIYRNDTGSE